MLGSKNQLKKCCSGDRRVQPAFWRPVLEDSSQCQLLCYVQSFGLEEEVASDLDVPFLPAAIWRAINESNHGSDRPFALECGGLTDIRHGQHQKVLAAVCHAELNRSRQTLDGLPRRPDARLAPAPGG